MWRPNHLITLRTQAEPPKSATPGYRIIVKELRVDHVFGHNAPRGVLRCGQGAKHHLARVPEAGQVNVQLPMSKDAATQSDAEALQRHALRLVGGGGKGYQCRKDNEVVMAPRFWG